MYFIIVIILILNFTQGCLTNKKKGIQKMCIIKMKIKNEF